MTCLPSASRATVERLANDCPGVWMQKSTWHVVPPNAAAVCPEVTSSIVTVPPNGMSRWVRVDAAGEHVLPTRVDHEVRRRATRPRG